jgi:uridine kinase
MEFLGRIADMGADGNTVRISPGLFQPIAADDVADGLAGVLEARGSKVFRASMTDFFRPRADRERAGWLDGKAQYREAFDYSLLRRVLVDPFHTAGSTGFVLTGFDAVRDQPIFQPKWMSAGLDAILILDGVFLHRPELAGLWNYSIWLSTPLLEAPNDGADGEEITRDAAADEAYLKDANPSEKATTIIDNQDLDHPRRVFVDSC